MDWTELYVLGASGHGKVVCDICLSCGYTVRGFIDGDQAKHGQHVLGHEVLGGDQLLVERVQAGVRVAVALGIGDNATRERVATWCREHDIVLPVLVHPSAILAKSASLGAGTVVMAGVAVNPDTEVGAGVILNTGCVVEHDNHIGDYAHLSANAATGGTVTVGARTHMGLNSAVLPNLKVGSDVILGAGGVIIRDVGDRVVMAGVPAKVLRKL